MSIQDMSDKSNVQSKQPDIQRLLGKAYMAYQLSDEISPKEFQAAPCRQFRN